MITGVGEEPADKMSVLRVFRFTRMQFKTELDELQSKNVHFPTHVAVQ